MAGTYKKKIRKRKTRIIDRSEAKYILFITVFCLVVGFVLAFITGNVPSFLDRVIQKQADRIIAEKMKNMETDVLEGRTQEDIADMVKRYKDRTRNYK